MGAKSSGMMPELFFISPSTVSCALQAAAPKNLPTLVFVIPTREFNDLLYFLSVRKN